MKNETMITEREAENQIYNIISIGSGDATTEETLEIINAFGANAEQYGGKVRVWKMADYDQALNEISSCPFEKGIDDDTSWGPRFKHAGFMRSSDFIVYYAVNKKAHSTCRITGLIGEAARYIVIHPDVIAECSISDSIRGKIVAVLSRIAA